MTSGEADAMRDKKDGESRRGVASKLSWVEKYRSKELHEICGQARAVGLVRSLLGADGGKTMPHLMLCGPAGTGKTSLVNVLVRELYGRDLSVRERSRCVLELNASKDRDIEVMRARVKVFAAGLVPTCRFRPRASSFALAPSASDDYDTADAETARGGGGGKKGARARCGFKLVVLDEADRMTVDAQTSLRMTIETYSDVTRYVILCNRQASMIEALQSRCTPVPFRALVESQLEAILRRVIRAERLRVEHEDKVVSALALQAKGDARRALGFLQSAAATCDYDCITMHDVNDVTAHVHDEIVRDVLRQCCGPAWHTGPSLDAASPTDQSAAPQVSAPGEVDVAHLMRLAQKVCADGYAIDSFLEQLCDLVTATVALADPHKWSISQTIAIASHRLTMGGDQEIQLTFALVDIARQCLSLS